MYRPLKRNTLPHSVAMRTATTIPLWREHHYCGKALPANLHLGCVKTLTPTSTANNSRLQCLSRRSFAGRSYKSCSSSVVVNSPVLLRSLRSIRLPCRRPTHSPTSPSPSPFLIAPPGLSLAGLCRACRRLPPCPDAG